MGELPTRVDVSRLYSLWVSDKYVYKPLYISIISNYLYHKIIGCFYHFSEITCSVSDGGEYSHYPKHNFNILLVFDPLPPSKRLMWGTESPCILPIPATLATVVIIHLYMHYVVYNTIWTNLLKTDYGNTIKNKSVTGKVH